jgi:mannose-6-phosphate isomerase-like protein (cupin superfamily)
MVNTDGAAPAPGPALVIVPPDGGRAIRAFGSTAVFKLGGAETGGAVSLAFAETPAGAGPPAHVHRRDDELFVVLEGEISFWTPSGWVPTTPGTVVFAPRNAAHTFRNTGTSPSRHLVLTLPSGFEEFYARSAALFAGGPPNPAEMQALAAEYGYEFMARG